MNKIIALLRKYIKIRKNNGNYKFNKIALG